MRLGNLLFLGRLDRYIGGLFAASYATAFLLVVGLFVIADLASHLSFFEPGEDGTTPGVTLVLEYYALSIPFIYAQISPFITVVAAMFTVTRLVRKNELSAGLSAGISAQRLLATILLGALLAVGLTVAIREGATGSIGFRRDAIFDRLDERRPEAVLENFRFRDLAGTVVTLGEYRSGNSAGRPPGGRGLATTIQRGSAVVRISADEFRWAKREGKWGWQLTNGLLRETGATESVRSLDWLEMVEFTPQDVLTAEKARKRVLELSFGQVLDLSARDPDNTSFQTLLQWLLTFPLANVVLVLCAVPFLIGRERGKGGEAVMGGLLLCVGYFCLDFVTRSMGLSGELSPLMSAWIPVLVFGALGITLTHHMRS